MSDVAAYHVFVGGISLLLCICVCNAHPNTWYAATSLIIKKYS